MARFTLPRDIYYGAGAIEELKKSGRVQKGNDPDRRQFHETWRLFRKSRKHSA